VAYISYNYFTSAYKHHLTEEKGKARRNQRDQKKFTFPQVTKEKTKKIVEACGDVTMLRNMQINGEVSSVDLVSVFAQRCHTIGRKFNLVTEEYYHEALDEARVKDLQTARAIKEKKVQELGLLHGIPISIKDHVYSLKLISFIG
jgi:hypothetical protein